MLQKIESTGTPFAQGDWDQQNIDSSISSVETPTFNESHTAKLVSTNNLLSERLTLRFADEITTLYEPDNVETMDLVDDFDYVNLEERNAQNRIKLLSRKYARKSLSQEESARLDMLTERLRNLIPEISEAEIQQMEQFTEILERTARSAEEIADELNITL
ncbi:MAG: hypothetical protein JAY85_10850 [Candidatus Thiodiazotropha weberae]|uniref:Uncharacterized protein n=1 Tax=Candidatus Thiodiazotropha endoloripes TaxID=1818881 RepID=A0A1E2UPC3_9GAMM|nr:hypothetical protein [Candidatus Thiodiazotropha endoloripes]MCG7898943.1 hypothetical protein [Candidatus Thiodiazotropha weberae]ODB96394.1 hypothetical protein A3196_06265 [Candidatus Thiodiazotropha endoloripes]